MKILRFIILLIVLFLAFEVAALAALEDELDTGAISGALTDEAREILGDYSPLSTDTEGAVSRLVTYLKGKLHDVWSEVSGSVVKILAVVVLCSLVSGLNLCGGFDYVNLAGCLAISVLTISDVNSLIRLGSETLEDISTFSKALLPTLGTAAAASGAVSSAAIKYAATAMFMDILINVARGIIFPMICAYTACVLATGALGDKRLDAVTKLIKKVTAFLMTALVTAFTAYLGITGIIASSTDAVTVKAVKSTISALPFVGRTIADAAGAIVAGAGLVKSCIGVFGLIASLAICAMPFLRLGLRYLLFKAAAAVAGPISGERISKMIDGIGAIYGMILAVVGIGGVFIFFGVISLIKVVGG